MNALKQAADKANQTFHQMPCRETRKAWLEAKAAYERAAERSYSAI